MLLLINRKQPKEKVRNEHGPSSCGGTQGGLGGITDIQPWNCQDR